VGTSAPTFKELRRYANKTRTPLGNFFLSQPPTINLAVPDFRTHRDMEISSPSPDLIETIGICKARQDWFRDYAIANELGTVGVAGSISRFADITDVASNLRSLLAFDIGERSNLATLDDVYRHLSERLDELGVLVMKNGMVGLNTHRKLNPEEFRGFALFDEYAPLIFVNGADVRAAHIFTLCHEFVHIAVGESALTNAATPEAQVETVYTNSIERWCNQVAAEILIPADHLRREFDSDSHLEAETHRLSRIYKTSKHVVLHSLKDANLVTWESFEEAYNALRDAWGSAPKLNVNGGGDFYRGQIVRLGRRLSTALVSDTIEGQTLYSDAYRLLGSKKHDSFMRFAKELGLR